MSIVVITMSFGNRVKRIRIDLQLTQKEFASQAKISRRDLQMVEGDSVNPTILVATQIKEASGCSWQDLLG